MDDIDELTDKQLEVLKDVKYAGWGDFSCEGFKIKGDVISKDGCTFGKIYLPEIVNGIQYIKIEGYPSWKKHITERDNG